MYSWEFTVVLAFDFKWSGLCFQLGSVVPLPSTTPAPLTTPAHLETLKPPALEVDSLVSTSVEGPRVRKVTDQSNALFPQGVSFKGHPINHLTVIINFPFLSLTCCYLLLATVFIYAHSSHHIWLHTSISLFSNYQLWKNTKYLLFLILSSSLALILQCVLRFTYG